MSDAAAMRVREISREHVPDAPPFGGITDGKWLCGRCREARTGCALCAGEPIHLVPGDLYRMAWPTFSALRRRGLVDTVPPRLSPLGHEVEGVLRAQEQRKPIDAP